jgi:hypothetical protein
MANFNIDYLVVAGGASGANQHGGGGGAGGLRTSYGSTSGGGASAEPTLSLTTGTSYSLTVGDGGAGVTWVGANLAGNNGYDSVFNNITSIGGGGGSSYATQTIPSSGGSGGGGGSQAVSAQTGASGEPGQGYAGGSGFTGGTPYPGGGGGGAGGLGGNATTGVGGNGGDGLQNDITVTTTGTGPYYAGGGGSATYGSGTPGTGGSGIGGAGKYTNSNGNPGNPQTGSGGGGTNGGFPSGSGGSGIVVLRYPTADVASYTATGLTPTKTTVGTDTVLSFTTVGTGTITFTSSTPTGTISTGEMIFNSTTDKVEYWDGTKWYGITYESTGESPYNNVLYTGNGIARSITGVGFEPDLVWIKKRNSASNSSNMLFDSVRGVDKVIITDSTQAQYDGGGTGYQTSFDTDGFSITGNGFVNSGNTFVAWCFKAGGTAVANTNGNIASQVSANVAGGFSIVKWSGNDTTGGTIGHGLSSTPELTIIKKTSASANWQVSLNASVTGVEGYMNLDTTAGLYTTYPLYYTSSNSTVLSSNGTSTTTRLYNNQSADYIAYCFHSVAGYSKIGSFVGTGAAGLKIDLDFEPAYILTKRTSSSGASWAIIDNKRSTGSNKNNYLQANSSAAEASSSSGITFNTDGFTFNGSSFNTNGATHMYYAIA